MFFLHLWEGERRGEEVGSSFFALERKRKLGAYALSAVLNHCLGCISSFNTHFSIANRGLTYNDC